MGRDFSHDVDLSLYLYNDRSFKGAFTKRMRKPIIENREREYEAFKNSDWSDSR